MRIFLFFFPLIFLSGCESEEQKRQEKLDAYIILYEKKYGKEEADLKRAELEFIYLEESQKESIRFSNNLATGMVVGTFMRPKYSANTGCCRSNYSCSKCR